ncbi:MAG: adenine phosphoribosyltransferase [Bacteroidales bacterium]|jgi:adenine phosphoribosyltransferase|nr:adenine phosphoribosyltransferase [Bacteroidales bacterium]
MIDINKVRIVEDFPTKGIRFYDITTVLNDPESFSSIFKTLVEKARQMSPEVIVGLEARGFYFAPALALALNLPFVPIRKKGKLPYLTYTETYQLEYGQAQIEIHQDAMKMGKRVLIIDDILATGGTANAAAQLVNNFQPAEIMFLFFMELSFLEGRKKLGNRVIETLEIV